jgi:hypothetical protein
MLGPFVVILLVVVIAVALLMASAGGRSRREGKSTAGHYDPDAIGQYTLDPATMRYRYDLPTLPRSGAPAAPGSGPPRRRRRRRRRTDTEGG